MSIRHVLLLSCTIVLAGCSSVQSRPQPPRALGWIGGRVLVEFQYRADRTVQTVHLAGSFNNWTPPWLNHLSSENSIPISLHYDRNSGLWRVIVLIEPGTHQYKFILNGTDWVLDPVAARSIED